MRQHMKISNLIIAAAAVCVPLICQAEYDSDGLYRACVKYQRSNYSWSNGYKVRGIIVKGDELNKFARKKGYYSNYSYSKNYFVIPWKEGGYSALELGYIDEPYSTWRDAKDQENDRWQIKGGWSFCN